VTPSAPATKAFFISQIFIERLVSREHKRGDFARTFNVRRSPFDGSCSRFTGSSQDKV
jgi:hypothetical protein